MDFDVDGPMMIFWSEDATDTYIVVCDCFTIDHTARFKRAYGGLDQLTKVGVTDFTPTPQSVI
jgi:hypothetical protein